MKTGIVVFSFALGKNEPNPCNVSLARVTREIATCLGDRRLVVAQWEVAKALKGVKPDLVVEKHRQEGAYLDSLEVMAQAAEAFSAAGITEVIVVAQPFLHLTKCRSLARQAGFTVLDRKIEGIGFYKQSLQWWTRSWWQLLAYAVLQRLFGRKGR